MLGVALLTLSALVLRLLLMRQSLFGDELFTYADLAGRGVDGVVDHVANAGVEDNPPGFYVLAELASRVDDAPYGLRLPSVVLSAATVPVLYVVGCEVAGARAGLAAAAIWAAGPFVLFYGTEGRAYAMLAFLVALATWAALRRWWVLYALAVCAALYTHYTAVFVLAAQVAWLWFARREDRRAVLIATGLAALAYVPWIPSFIEQGSDASSRVIGAFYPLSLRSFGEGIARPFCCHPYVPAGELPGVLGLVLLVAGAIVLAVGSVLAPRVRPTREQMLVVVLAAATPVGLLVYSAVGTGIFAPRNLTASIPAACLLAGWLLSRLPARIALASGGLLAAGLLLGVVVSLDASKQRPNLAAAAAFIDAHAGAREPYAEVPLFFSSAPELAQGLRLNFERPHPSEPVAFRATAGRVRPSVPRRAWLAAAGGRRLFIVGPELPNLSGLPQPPPGLASRVRRQDTRRFAGFFVVRVELWGPAG